MSDDLVVHLHRLCLDDGVLRPRCGEAADALEAKEREIAELRADNGMLEGTLDSRDRNIEDILTESRRRGAEIERLRAEVESLKRDAERLQEAWQAACTFIDSHVADPDITAEMTRAYAEFQRHRAAMSQQERA